MEQGTTIRISKEEYDDLRDARADLMHLRREMDFLLSKSKLNDLPFGDNELIYENEAVEDFLRRIDEWRVNKRVRDLQEIDKKEKLESLESEGK